NRTEWDYDTAYKLYVVAERAPKYFANGSLAADTRFVTSYANDNVCGKPSKKTDWNGIAETYSYDPYCRPYDTVNAGTGSFTKVRYTNEGNPTSQAVTVYTPGATESTVTQVFQQTYYDGLGRPYNVQSYGDVAANPRRVTETGYDARGNVKQVALPRFVGETAQWTVNSYDWQDRVVKTVNPDASQRAYTYAVQPAASVPGSTNLPVLEQRMNNEEGKVSRSYLDKDNNVILTSGNLNNAWVNEVRSYDVVGRLTGVRDHSGAVWTYTYDLIGNRLTASDPDLGNWSYAYDNANRLVTQTDARGVVTTLAYDQMGRLLTKQVKDTDGVTIVLATNSYDTAASGVGAAPFLNVGLLTVSTNGSATQRFSQSLTGTGTVTTTQTEIDGLIQTTTDRKGKAGLTLSRSYSPGAVDVGTTTDPWTYNANNMLVTIPGYVTAASYEADGQTKSISYANGVATTFTYLPQRDWLTRVTTKKGTVSLLDSQYTRDKLGRIKSITGLTPAENWTYAYDDISRLVTATNAGDASLSETYTYSLTGNLLSRTKMGTYTYPAGNAVRPHAATKIGTKVLSYDANGNM
ncbi:RHS repeat protein, partial [Rhizobium wenxiniae]